MMLPLYKNLSRASGPFLAQALKHRARQGKEEPARMNERRGIASLPRPEGLVVWCHGASIGESLSLLPLVDRLLELRPDLNILITTGTVTSAALLSSRLTDRACHQYVPLDHPTYVARFLDHWRPDLAIWIESELWPNLLLDTRERRIPMALVNARMSAISYRRWRLFPGAARSLLEVFDICLAQSEEAAERLKRLGAPSVVAAGNLKYASPPLEAVQEDYQLLAAAMGHRPRWLAASTHPGEERLIAHAHRALAETYPDLLTVIVPRHPRRGEAILKEITALGLNCARRAGGHGITADSEIYIADTLGEMGLFYRLSAIVFIGGSLVPHGGHNPLEAAHLDCAILYGPYMDNFREIADTLKKAHAAIEIADEKALIAAVDILLATPQAVAEKSAAAQQAASAHLDVAERVAKTLATLLPPEEMSSGKQP